MLAAAAAVALQDERTRPRQLVHVGLKFAQRDQTRALDARDLVFVRLAHVDERQRFLPIHFRLQLSHGNRRHALRRGEPIVLRWAGAKLFIIDRLENGRGITADRACRIAAQIELAEFHLQRVEVEKATGQGFACAEDQLQRLRRLDESDDSRQNAQHPGFRAARRGAWRWWFRKKAAVTGSTQMRREHAGLSFEAENGAVDIWFARENADVVGKITRRKII